MENEVDDKADEPKRKSGPDKNISFRQFIRYRLGWGRDDIYVTQRNPGYKPKQNCYHWLWTFRRLAEYFLITVINRIERMELDHTKKNQENLRKIMAQDYVNAIEGGLKKEGKTLGKIFMVPKTFKGSNKFYQKAYADLMTVVRRIGNPTWYLTWLYKSFVYFSWDFSQVRHIHWQPCMARDTSSASTRTIMGTPGRLSVQNIHAQGG
jgi:hypothetical protein